MFGEQTIHPIKNGLNSYQSGYTSTSSAPLPLLQALVYDILPSTTAIFSYAKLQALLYDILPSTTAVFSYAIGSRKLSANEQFFVGAQTVVSLLQTTHIISDICFITDPVASPA